MSEVGRLYVLFDANGKPYIKGLRDIENQTARSAKTMEQKFSEAGKKAGKALAAGLAVGAAAIAGIGVASVKAAASFEYEMSRIKANASGTSAEMKKLESTVIDLGKKTAFSAGETAQAANELVKAGLTLGETMEALPGMLDLAAAGELGVAQAAELTANTLSQFTLKVGDAAMVADVLANAANKSTTGVTEIGQSLENVATISANMGWTLQETSSAIALLANNGVKGAEAGTSLKSMLMQLMTPTEAAATMMERYGISLYDANGESVTAEVLLRRLEEAFVGLSDADRDLAAGTIFGSYGIKAANILIKEGADAFADMTKEVSEAGAAQDIAATKLDNLAGSYEQLKGSIETAAIMMGTEGIPGLRELVDGLTEETNAFVETWEKMTGTDVWKSGGFEVKFDLAVETIGATLLSLGEKAVDALTGVDWGPVATTITDAIGVAIENAPPWVVKVALDMVKDTFTSGDTAKNMLKYGNLGMLIGTWLKGEEGEYEAYQRKIMGGDKSPQAVSGLWDMVDVTKKLSDEQRELGEETERAWIQQQKQEHALEASKEAALEYADAVETMASDIEQAADYTEENLSKIGDALNAVAKESMATWEKAGGDLDKYIEDLQAQYDAIANASENIKTVMQTLGESGALAEFAAKGWNPDAVQNILLEKITAEPEILEALVGADPDTVESVIQKWMNLIWQESEGQKRVMLDEQASLGEEGAGSFEDAFGHRVASSNAMSDAIKDALDVDVSSKGRETALSYIQGWVSTLSGWNPLSGVSTSSGSFGPRPKSRAWGGPVGEYGWGGPVGLPAPQKSTGRAIPIIAHEGEWVLTENQTKAMFGYAEGGEVVDPFKVLDPFGSYISRESSRYSAASAGAGDFLDMGEIIAMSGALARQIEFLALAVEDAEKQLAVAKKAGATPGEINELAENLYDLQADASRAREELEELSRVPLEQALDRWNNELDQTEAMMDLMGSTSGLLTRQLGTLGGQYQSFLDLMNDATDPDEIMRYGQDAIDTLLDMYNDSVDTLSRTLSDATDAVRDEQGDWEEAWDERRQAVDDAYQSQLDTIDAQAEAVGAKYQDEVDAVREQQKALRDAWASQDRARTIGGLQSDRANILAQGYYTEDDVRRIEELDEQIAMQQEQARREQQMAALEASAVAKQEEQQEALEKVEAQRLAAEQAHQAQIVALEAERQEQMAAFEARLASAEAAYAQEVEALKLKYGDMVQTVIDQEAVLTGQSEAYTNAGRLLGESFAAGLTASIGAVVAAAQAVAQAAANNLELHSPAKEGPLSSLDDWWKAFPDTLLKPFDITGALGSAMNAVTPGGGGERVEIHLTSDGNGVTDGHLEAVASRVASIIDQRTANASVSWGRRAR